MSKQTKQQIKSILYFIFAIGFVFCLFFGSKIVFAAIASGGMVEKTGGSDMIKVVPDPTISTSIKAKAAKSTCVATMPCPQGAVAEVSESIWDRIISPSSRMIMVKSLMNVAQFVTNRLAYEAALLVANGGPGQGSMFYKKSPGEAFKDFGLDVAGEAIGDLNDILKASLGTNFNLCAPTSPLIRLNLQIGIKQAYTPAKPRCDWDQISKNWQQITTDTMLAINDKDAANNTLLQRFAAGLRPGNNELGASIGLAFTVDNKVQEAKTQKYTEMLSRISVGGLGDVKDIVTGTVKTPAAIVDRQFQDQLAAVNDPSNPRTQITPGEILASPDVWWGLLGMAGSTFTNTLTSQLFNRVYKGLFDVEPDKFDPFNKEMINPGNSIGASKNNLSSVFAVSPISVSDFNILGEFSVCPPVGVMNRGLNNCVIDSDFSSAITRGGTGGSLTVQEAINEKLLKSDWPLISSKNTAANQDSLCYTYGYCFGNLVKLRKARILPVGWEMAADKNITNNPKTLGQIVSAFNDCNEQGTIDSAHPWCHLIDPNWVLKSPQSQCRATVNGEIRVGTFANGRQSYCADSPTCIGEDNAGNCTQGFGYCVQEKNVWRVRGDECPDFAATCLSLENTKTGKENAFLVNTVDYSICNQTNAGCSWFKTQKQLNDGGTLDTKDDKFDWLFGKQNYNIEDHSNVYRFQTAGNITSSKTIYNYPSVSGPKSYQTYSYEDQLYLTHQAKICTQENAGCSELISNNGNVILNMVQNPSFEIDEDKDGNPDQWNGSAKISMVTESPALDGSVSLGLEGASADGFAQNIKVTPGNFYTFSFYASTKAGVVQAHALVTPLDQNGTLLPLDGLSYGGDCTVLNNSSFNILKDVVLEDGWKRFACTFTLPQTAVSLNVKMSVSPKGTQADLKYDSVQLEAGENANVFVTGYNDSSVQKTYLKLPPSYLGCKGLTTDPKECANFAQVCSAQDVGCNSYTPKETGPSIPAIVSDLDRCPSECVGYDTYKQEKTTYETAKFPLYFIPTQAKSCTANAVGCDGFTNIGSSAETQEYYTNLRACATPDMMSENNQTNPSSATYFTWEGSDKTGYQLRTWSLLKSNSFSSTLKFTGSNFEEKNVSMAPCAKWQVQSPGETVICQENQIALDEIAGDNTCDEHNDIYTNPNCREFFDKNGVIHYREYSSTVSIDSACTAYRKNESTKEDCNDSGGFWTDQGFCRYYGLQKESKTCSANENGCREFTGGAGRNSSTILDETFESGTYTNFEVWKDQLPKTVSISPSNDSVAAGGKSLRVVNSSNGHTGIQTVVSALSSNLVRGKTYSVSFWAKGTGKIYVGMQDNGGTAGSAFYDFADPKNIGNVTGLSLDGNWKVFNLGPLNTSEDRFAKFDQNAVLFFFTDKGMEFNIDNIRLIQGEENITLIKNSWVTPSVCDSAPSGELKPQYYLGCKGYTDQNGKDANVYQFSSICSEKVVGCSAFFSTANSDATYASVNNARCVFDTDGNLASENTVAQNTDCKVNNVSYCTITTGKSYCVFNAKTDFQDPLPFDIKAGFGIMYGPETVITPADKPVYIVDNKTASCTQDFKGCREVGVPVYSQDLKTVTSFTSKYILDDPNSYDKILCENQALFCDEFASNKDGKFYFKDPINKTCEYKSSATVGKKTYKGWFKSGTSEPCYPSYVVGGENVGIWRNGDASYDGWVGSCDSANDRCTQFIDTTDTSSGTGAKGTSYYVVNNAKLDDKNNTDTQRCDGKVSQKEGCAAFNNTTNSQLKYNQNASYVVSIHADLLLNKSPNSLVDPVNCNENDSGKFNVSNEVKNKLKLSTNTFDVCQSRCQYVVENNDSILSPSAKLIGFNTKTTNSWDERSCVVSSDCPILTTKFNQKIQGTCNINVPVADRLPNDANTIMKVVRDRSCAAWLACDSARTSWDANANNYIQICDSINLCSKGSAQGKENLCQNWTPREPIIFNDQQYSSRDTSWIGLDYSGYQIPNQLPVELYTQFNLNPIKVCNNNPNKSCINDVDCGKGNKCEENQEKDYRLVYNAGPCDSKIEGSDCQVGKCSLSQTSCGTADDCALSEDKCVIGYCQAKSTKTCSSNADCSVSKIGNTNTNECDTGLGVCVDKVLSGNKSSWTACGSSNDCSGAQKCVTSIATAKGACYNKRCLTDVRDKNGDGFTDSIQGNDSLETQTCRGYPEVDSPFSSLVVKKWKTVNIIGEVDIGNAKDDTSTPYEFRNGYKDAKTCAPDNNGKVPKTCVCSYKKIEYGKGTGVRYYGTIKDDKEIPSGICVGGRKEGSDCLTNADCEVVLNGNNGTKQEKDPYTNKDRVITGTCELKSSQSILYGWEGYCLEYDSSIQLNGSTETKDRVCLTWLPVDQLVGTTDLYGKEYNAGFVGDVSYCAEPAEAWDFGTSDIACAETHGGNCDDTQNISGVNDDTPEANCPVGFFAVMSACGTATPPAWEGYCGQSDGDDDYPYFCVPYNSYKTQDENIIGNAKVGDPCVIPPSLPDPVWKDVTSHEKTQDEKIWISNQNTKVYYQPWGIDTLYNYYDDCKVRGIFQDELKKYFGDETPTSYPRSSNDDTYRELGDNNNFQGEPYPACKSVVQVSSGSPVKSGNTQRYNAAWTNRLWETFGYQLKTDDQKLAYSVITETSPFGKAIDPLEKNKLKDPDPDHIVMCKQVIKNSNEFTQILSLPGTNDKCPSNDDIENKLTQDGGLQGRSYTPVNLYNQWKRTSTPQGNPPVEKVDIYKKNDFTGNSETDLSNAQTTLKQIFAKASGLMEFTENEKEEMNSEKYLSMVKDTDKGSWLFDIRKDSNAKPPTIVSVGNCVGTSCYEKNSGKFTVNGSDEGDVFGVLNKRINVSFYVFADTNQMPIRQIVTDWGDDFKGYGSGSQSGSISPDNFYKNYRGKSLSGNKDFCDDAYKTFGQSKQACSSGYVLFTHDYVCSPNQLQKMKTAQRFCEYEGIRVKNSPCVDKSQPDACVFQPRVNVVDNWGWCTGTCNGTDGCFEYACDVQVSSGDKGYDVNINPWINYSGVIRIKAE